MLVTAARAFTFRTRPKYCRQIIICDHSLLALYYAVLKHLSFCPNGLIIDYIRVEGARQGCGLVRFGLAILRKLAKGRDRLCWLQSAPPCPPCIPGHRLCLVSAFPSSGSVAPAPPQPCPAPCTTPSSPAPRRRSSPASTWGRTWTQPFRPGEWENNVFWIFANNR